MNKLLRVIFLVSWVFLLMNQMIAGNTGKIVGKVTDAKTGEAIPSVNILVVGTTRGASSDLDGKFTIIGIPIGSYTVRASAVQYGTVEISEVKIDADVTRPLDFKLTSSDVQIGGVTITAEQLVNNLSTSGEQTVNQKSIEAIPNVKTVEDVLKQTVGFVQQGKNLYLRGGRPNEVQYVVDGVVTNNLIGNSSQISSNQNNQQLSNVYAGIQSGTIGGDVAGISISTSAIQSVSVQTSGFDADFGNVQSGVINIVTKSGPADKYIASSQFRTDKIAATNQNETYGAFSFGGPEPFSKYLLPELGLKLPGTLTFFFNADMDRADGPYNFAQNQFYNPVQRRIEFNGLFGGILNGTGFNFYDNLSNAFSFTSKLRYDVGDNQFSYSYNASLSSGEDYSTAFNYLADSSNLKAKYAINHTLSIIHFFSNNSFAKLILGEVENHDGNDVAGLLPGDYSPITADLNNDGFYDIGTGQSWYTSETHDWSLRFDINSQVHPLHLLKTGFEFHYLTVNSTEIDNPTYFLSIPGDTIPFGDPKYQRGAYPGYGEYRYVMNDYPNRGGAYVQDNIEFSGLNIHLGLRYDYLDIGKQVYDESWIAAWKTAVQWTPTSIFQPDWAERVKDANGNPTTQFVRMTDGSTFLWYATHGYISPRLAIGYPVTDRIVFYFNYGHFLQFPDLNNYYQDPTLTAPGNFVGNPDLKPQRTIAYEAGFEDQFADDMSFSIRAFYKDIFDYATLAPIAGTGGSYLYINQDYASSRGFDFTINQDIGRSLSTTITYTYQIAKGRSSSPYASIADPTSYSLPRETRLDWDQTHTINLFLKYGVGPKEDSYIFGIPFNNYNISLTWNFGSGFPYSGFNTSASGATAQNAYLANSETGPYTSTFNLSFSKGLQILDLNLLATLDITNLLNRDNVNIAALKNNIAAYYGRPKVYGDLSNPLSPDPVILPWSQVASNVTYHGVFGSPRQILLGVKINWN